MLEIYLLPITLIIFFIFFKFNKFIAKNTNLFDKNKIPLIGGIFLILGIFINIFYIKINNLNSIYLVNIYFVSSMFLVALIDDRYNINPFIRMLLMIILIAFFVIKLELFIFTLNFKYLSFFYFSENIFIKVIFPIFCIVVFLNAFNFTDGINGISTLLALSWFIYIFIKFPFLTEIYYFFLIFMFFFLILNFLNKSYLGDSGNYIISIILSYLILIINREMPESIYAEEILLLLLIPGIDLIRLFFQRIKNKKNPLIGDLNHFHHLLLKKYSLFRSLVIYLLLVTLPLYTYVLVEDLLGILIFISILTYSLLVRNLVKI